MMLFWSSRMEIDSSKTQTTVDPVVLEVAKNLAGELVEGDADLLDVEDGIAGDLAAAAEVGGRRLPWGAGSAASGPGHRS